MGMEEVDVAAEEEFLRRDTTSGPRTDQGRS